MFLSRLYGVEVLIEKRLVAENFLSRLYGVEGVAVR